MASRATWDRLHAAAAGAPVEAAALRQALEEVAALPLDARWPWLAVAVELARHTAGPVRAAALDCLRGATGYPAEQLAVAALGDGDPAVVHAALRVVVEVDPAGWLHGCCHPDPSLRRAALALLPAAQQADWIAMLADPDARDAVLARLDAEGPRPEALGHLLDHVERGEVDEGWTCRLLRALPWAEGWPALVASLPGARPAPPPADAELEALWARPDRLDAVLGWLAARGPRAGDPLRPMCEAVLAGRAPGALGPRVATAAAAAALAAPARASAELVALAAWRWPALLHRTELPSEARRGALALLAAGVGGAQHGHGVELDPALLVEPDGVVRATVLHGALRLLGPVGARRLLAALPVAAVLPGLRAEVAVGARVVLEHGDEDRDARLGLLRAACGGEVEEAAPLVAACWLLAPDLAGPVVGAVAGPALLAAVAARMDPALGEHDARLDPVATALVQAHGAPVRVVAARLARPEPPGALTRRLLRKALGASSARAFVTALGPEGLVLLAEVDRRHPVVDAWILLDLVDAIGASPDPRVAAWLDTLRPAPAPPELRLPRPGRPGPLGKRAALRVQACPEDHLDDAVEPALAAPVTRLAAALRARPAPSRAHPRVCAALLRCEDPVDEVAWLLACYGLDHPEVAARVDRILLPALASTRRLGLAGACWLYRWDGPMSVFVRLVEGRPGGLGGLLHASLSWQCAALRGVAWSAAGRLVGAWRWRARARLASVVDAGLPPLLVSVLDDRGAPGRGLLGFPASRADRAAVTSAAAGLLLHVQQAGHDLSPWRARAAAAVLDLEPRVRATLASWLEPAPPAARARAAPPPRAPTLRPPPVPVYDLPTLIAAATDPAALVSLLRVEPAGAAELAALRLVELGEAGHAALLDAACADPGPHRWVLCQALGQVPEGPVRAEARRRLPDLPAPAARLCLALALAAPEAAVAAARAGADVSHDELAVLRQQVRDDLGLAVGLVLARSATAAAWAAEVLRQALPDPRAHAALCAFIDQGADGERLRSGDALWRHGEAAALPWALAWQASQARAAPHDAEGATWAARLSPAPADEVARAMMLAGATWAPGAWVLAGLYHPDLAGAWATAQAIAARVARETREADLGRGALDVLLLGPERGAGARRVAEVFRWGRAQSRKLLGRAYAVRAIGGAELGWTRLDESVIQVNPLPILRGERDGEAVVRGLLVHELGHHLYNADAEGLAAIREAQAEGLARLHNLVCDEHLERNLRVLDERYGDDLKRLGAWAFQHARRAEPATALRRRLGPDTVPVLSRSSLGPAREVGRVSIGVGRLLAALEAQRSSFARFVRALRMGRGDRHDDPRVAAALALFDRDFRRLDNRGLLEVTRALAALFEGEQALLELCDLHDTASPGVVDTQAEGHGVRDDDIQREVRRIDGAEELARRGAEGRGGVDVINVGGEERFQPLSAVEHLVHDPAAHAAVARDLQRHALELRRLLHALGLAHVVERPRLAGHRLDRSRLVPLATRGDPRVLAARRRLVTTDLFLGLVVDCSGSMSGPRMTRARSFATLVAEACRGLPGVDLRVIGFTDKVIKDAGDARRCAAHALEAGGGNNDAAGLWHGALLARQSRRSARLLVMVSDGLPTECTTSALRALVQRLTRKDGIACAQVAVHPLRELCFPDYIEILDTDTGKATRAFGRVIARLVARTLR